MVILLTIIDYSLSTQNPFAQHLALPIKMCHFQFIYLDIGPGIRLHIYILNINQGNIRNIGIHAKY